MKELIPGFTAEQLFRKGILAEWYLRPDQLELYDLLCEKKKVVVNTRRRYGKTTTAFVYIFERCLTSKIIVRIGGVTMKSLKDIFSTITDSIFEECPKLKPHYNHEDGCWTFHTGARIYLFGCSDKEEANKSRGALAHIIYCDEYGFWAYRAKYYLTSALSPQLDTTDGQLIITSTPPEDLTHDYIQQVSEAAIAGYYFVHTIEDSLKSGVISEDTHQKIIMRCGGTDTDAYKREYQCQLIASTSRLVIPEAQDEKNYVGEWKRPEKLQPNVMIDLGLKDFTFGIFGYVDFIPKKLIIEDECSINYKSTKEIIDVMSKKEKELEYKNPIRQADNEMQQLYDMSTDYKYHISPIVKAIKGEQNAQGYKDSIINSLRVAISTGKIVIHPRCKKLIKQLKYGIYNEQRTDFERTEELGHLDGVMALAYMNYHIDWNFNPYPHPWLSIPRTNDWHIPKFLRKKKIGDIY